MIKAAAAVHNRLPGDPKYLGIATKNWEWFIISGMINSDNMINDGLDADCGNNGQTIWTYNQGILLGAAVELARGDWGRQLPDWAEELADASTVDRAIVINGVLTEPCEANNGTCCNDCPTFKGVYVRNLGELNAALPGRPYQQFLEKQAATVYQQDRTSSDLYGVHWAGRSARSPRPPSRVRSRR